MWGAVDLASVVPYASVMRRLGLLALGLSLVFLAPGCGGPNECGGAICPIDVPGSDAGPRVDVGSDTGTADGGGMDAPSIDAGLDASQSDGGEPDASESDAGESDAGESDAGTDASHDAGTDAPPPLPETCTATAECGSHASCDTTLTPGRCVCTTGYAPCASGCCEVELLREVELEGGHAPEIGFDDAGNVYVLYLVGSTSVRLAEIAPDDTVTTTTVATSSTVRDAHDMVVEPDGTVHVAVHRVVGDRGGNLRLHTRLPGETAFTTMDLVGGGRQGFAFDAAIAIARAPGGDLYASLSERSGDGTAGLYVARYDAALEVWTALPNILGFAGHDVAEILARDDGFFIGTDRISGAMQWWDLDSAGGGADIVATTTDSASGYGELAGAIDDEGTLYAFAEGRLWFSDGRDDELPPFTGMAFGARTDIDMAIDRYGQLAIWVHSRSTHYVTLMVRMPLGGFSTASMSPDAVFLPFPDTATWMSLDAETTRAGTIGVAVGDSMDRGELTYREYAY